MEDRYLRKVEAVGSNPIQSITRITENSIEEYLSFLELKDVTKDHIKKVHQTDGENKNITKKNKSFPLYIYKREM